MPCCLLLVLVLNMVSQIHDMTFILVEGSAVAVRAKMGQQHSISSTTDITGIGGLPHEDLYREFMVRHTHNEMCGACGWMIQHSPPSQLKYFASFSIERSLLCLMLDSRLLVQNSY